jgi:UDP-N-acetylmuramyl-tripeptide synthetase
MAISTLTHLTQLPDVLAWLQAKGVNALTVDSRAVPAQASQGVGFIAWPGAARDGRAFVAQALNDGALACLVEADGVANFAFADERIAAVANLKATLAQIAHAFYGQASEQLDVVAVTGTNGKTSTSWWTAQALSELGSPCGVIGTLGVGQPGGAGFVPTGLTTPDPVTLHGTFRQFVKQGLKAAAIEASSIGIEEKRLDAARITVAQFTNFTQDHLDYHGSMAAYWQAKQALFEWPGLKAAVVNVDDVQGEALLPLCTRRGLDVWTYGLVVKARLQAREVSFHAEGMRLHVVEFDQGLQHEVGAVDIDTHLIGEFNASNLLAVIGALRALGFGLQDAAQACATLSSVPGRMQQVRLSQGEAEQSQSQPLVVVDYAHTPDALHKALLALRSVTQARGGRLWCVFGCGGNRDALKRPLMGAMADQHADEVVLTSDNPRNESACFILSQILAGVTGRDRVAVIENRHDAIVDAIGRAAAQDVVLIAGKGHEATQEVAGVKTPFSDVEESMAALRARLNTPSGEGRSA